MTTEGDFEKAASFKSVPFVSQQATESSGNGSQEYSTAHKKSPDFQGFAKPCIKLQKTPMEDNGLEPMTFWLPDNSNNH